MRFYQSSAFPAYLLMGLMVLFWAFLSFSAAYSSELRGTIHQVADMSASWNEDGKPTLVETSVPASDLYFKVGEPIRAGGACFYANVDPEILEDIKAQVRKVFLYESVEEYKALFKDPGSTGCVKAADMGKPFFPGTMTKFLQRTYNRKYCSELWEVDFDLEGADGPVKGMTWTRCRPSAIQRLQVERDSSTSG